MTTRHRRRIRETSIALEARRSALKNAEGRLREAGRVLSAANEDLLRTALQNISNVLAALDAPAADTEEAKESREKAIRLAEAYSGSADDAGDGAYILSALLDLMSDESDEPDDLAILQGAFSLLMQWLMRETAEIGTADDDTEVPYDPWGMYWESARDRLKASGGPITRSGERVRIREGRRIITDLVPLSEAVVREDGTTGIKLIGPGWGSTGFYCLSPETPILCTDLVWRPVGNLAVGQEIIGFDEKPEGRTKYRRASVESVGRADLPSFEIETPFGVTVASADHMWLVRRDVSRSKNVGPYRHWVRTADLKVDDLIVAFGAPWGVDDSREAGYLAGLFDGEGTLDDYGVSFAQREGQVLARGMTALEERGFATTNKASGGSDGRAVAVRGGRYSALKLLGQIRPVRLLEKSARLWEGHETWNGSGPTAVPVTRIAPTGVREVVTIGTSTRTLVANGLLSHNSPEVLEAGASVFPAGTKMFWDHPTLSEEWERPERSLRDLAAELTTDAVWNPDGAAGAGLYAEAKVFSPYREVLDEIAPSIGVSIVAYGKAENGTAEGKSGTLITELVAADSVDFVTYPGAGGQVLSLIEAARQRLDPISPRKEEPRTMDVEKEPKYLEAIAAKQAAEQDAARLREQVVSREAKDLVAAKLSESKLPEITRQRLESTLGTNPPSKDGALDKPALEQKITEAMDAEVEYLTNLTKAGQIRGMGVSGGGDEKLDGELAKAFQGLGMSESAAKVAASGRK